MHERLQHESTDVALIAKPGGAHTGVGRYVHMLLENLAPLNVNAIRVEPSLPPLTRAIARPLVSTGIDLRSFLTNYPIWAQYPEASVYHLSSQNLASMLIVRRPAGPIVVTVHDIIPYILRDDAEYGAYQGRADRAFDHLAMRGLSRADHLVADSAFTKRTLIEHLNIPSERISVVHLGIDHDRFQNRDPDPTIRDRYGLKHNRRYIMFVGSEDPRKNLRSLIRALAEVRKSHNEVELIKVGRAHFDSERSALLSLAADLGVMRYVHFLDDVPEDDLPALYNLASMCAMPSMYEGFGFPVLEAMACGTPVVCANASSLPELAGEAAVMFDPANGDYQELACSIERVLKDDALRQTMVSHGYVQAKRFTWTSTASQMVERYGQLRNMREHQTEERHLESINTEGRSR
jgi:glycosyltransferase involved in cell wall biosynthesis